MSGPVTQTIRLSPADNVVVARAALRTDTRVEEEALTTLDPIDLLDLAGQGGGLLGDPFGPGLAHGVEQVTIVRVGIGGRGRVELGRVEGIRHRRGLP